LPRKPPTRRRWPARAACIGLCLLLAALTAGAAVVAFRASPKAGAPRTALASSQPPSTTTTAAPTTTTTAAPTTTTTSTLPPPGPGFVAGRVTAVGDSVMLDYQAPLQTDIPGVVVDATVSRQWGAGETIFQQLKAEDVLGAEVIVGLGTNGPITSTDFDSMMAILSGASRVVFVNVHVDRPWQDPNNAVLASGVTRYPNAVVADFATLAAQNPAWFGADGTHLAIAGTGADALASLITTTLAKG
jgi:hypothetical protein